MVAFANYWNKFEVTVIGKVVIESSWTMKAMIVAFSMLSGLSSIPAMAQIAPTANYSLLGLTIAINDMPTMLKFYQNVFGISFESKEQFGAKLHEGNWGNLKLVFCPADVAGNTATQNKHQFEILVDNLDEWIRLCVNNGGQIIGEVNESNSLRSVGIYDPDKNSLVLKEYIN